ncbi:unnamed protein product [Rotaria sordida]|uniref:Globin-sensor domain-containing protein n=1 Tax=Rotaria sordida TaxID=392033 RepID=A0A819BKJ0_9BILA|nr:unnamed protein product [Rotaria sordida]CAF3799682.1 unnamed protein product [Rotaria sordida]
MAEHIDSNRLNSDLRYRFEYVSKFLNFTLDDIAMLNTFAPIIFPIVPVITDTVYRKLFSFDITKHYFLIRNEGFEGFLPKTTSGITLDSPQMELRKDMLSVYLKRVLTQREWNDTFLQYLSQVGKMHTNGAGSASINVDYIHINALLGYLEHLLIDVLWSADSIDDKTRQSIVMAINKFFWIQNDFFTMHYLASWKESSTSNETSMKKNKYCFLSETQSSTSSRRTSSISSHMASTNVRLRRSSIITGRQSSIIDTHENKQSKQQQQQQTPVKVLVVNGKCSEIFKSTLEDCVEECILEFTGENSIYVPKSGQATQIPVGNKQIFSSKEPSSNVNQSTKLNRRRSSVNQFNLPQIGNMRTSQTSNFSFSNTALTITSASRMRHQLIQSKFSPVEDISEEATDLQTIIEQVQKPLITETDCEHPHISQEEIITRQSNNDTLSQSISNSHRKIPSARTHLSYSDRQKVYRLSDLVMLGPEYFTHIFNLPRTSRYATQTSARQRSSTQQGRNKPADKYDELDRIKQDLFHRYLWTQKPQVSCRIRPISTYTRSTTFVI